VIRLPTRVADVFAGPFLVGVAAVVVFAVWAANDAGYASTTWYPGGLFLLALAVVTVVAYGGVSLSPPALVAIVFLGAFAAWCALSITWASDKGIAWDGANRTVLYFLVYALFVSLPWRRESIPFLLVGFSLAVLAIGLVALARSAGDPSAYFMKGRFSAPAGYPNGACALYLLAFWPVAYAAVRRELPVVVRGGLMATAAALVELALLCQSRGSLFAVPIAIVAYLLIVPGRLRAAIGLAFVALTVLSVRTRLLDVFEPIRDGQDSRAAVHRALAAIGISCAAAFAVWSLVSLLDRRVDLGARTVRTANLAGLTLAGAALVAGLVFVATSRDRIDRSWHNFKAGYPTQTTSSHFSLGVGSNRYDFWRVAVLEFRHHPLQGVGVDNFAQDYILERRSGEEPLYPHSLELRVLGQTGVIGTLLFAGFLVAAVLSVVKARGTDLAGGLARAGVAAAAYIAIHGSADWFWEFPALTAPALAWLGLAGSGSARTTRARPVALVAVGLGCAAAAVSFAFPWVAELEARRAVDVWVSNPRAAFADLDRSRSLNPLSTRADLLAGAIASRVNDLPRMQQAFSRALGRDSGLWYAHLELGLAEAGLGQRRAALRELRAAAKLNPHEAVIPEVARLVKRGRPIDRRAIDSEFVRRIRAKVGP
jgi:hypothetical protein